MSKVPPRINSIIDAMFDVGAKHISIGLGSAVNYPADQL